MANPVIYIKDADTSTVKIANDLFVKTGIIQPQKETEEVDINNLDVMNNPGIGMSNAVVQGVSKYMEATIQGFISAGMTYLLQTMGINEETMNIAKQVLNIADNSITLVSSIIKSTPSDVYMIPSGNSVPAVICASLRDMYDALILGFKEQVVDEWNNMVTNLPDIEQVQYDLIMSLIAQAELLIDAQCVKYTGYTLMQLIYMVKHYIALYKQYRQVKKQEKEDNIENTKSKTSVQFDSKAVKEQLMKELEDSSDLIYNAFIIVQIKDTITQIQEIVKLFSDADISILTENIDSFEDTMDLLVEMGLGNDETSNIITLSDALTSSINSFYKDTQQLLGAMGAQALQSGYNIANSAVNSISINTYNLYKFKADPENMCIVMTIYKDPTTKSFNNQLYKTLSKKDENNNQIISNADIIRFFDVITAGYQNDLTEQEIIINNKKYIIKYDIKQTESDIQLQENDEIDIDNSIELGVVTESYTLNPYEKKKRPTLQLAHELFAILKQFLPILKIIVKLISNYKINKEKVKNHAQGNLYAMARIISNIKGLNNKININNVNFYTIRTLKFYEYITTQNIYNQNNSPTVQISNQQTVEIRQWLIENNEEYETLNEKLPTLLYIDYDAINQQKNNIQNQINNIGEYIDDPDIFVKYPDTKYHDGDILGLDTVEYIGDEVYYSDSSLPVYGSQILRAINKN